MGGLHDPLAGGKDTLRPRRFEHAKRDAVFDAPGGVLTLELGEQAHTSGHRNVLQFHEGRLPDQLSNACSHHAHSVRDPDALRHIPRGALACGGHIEVPDTRLGLRANPFGHNKRARGSPF